MPTKVLIISDMEFDSCSEVKTNFQVIRDRYRDAGYDMPNLVFWNLRGRERNNPTTVLDANTALIGGFSPSILKSVLGGKDLSPYGVYD